MIQIMTHNTKYGVDGIRAHDLPQYVSMLVPLSYTHSCIFLYCICIYLDILLFLLLEAVLFLELFDLFVVLHGVDEFTDNLFPLFLPLCSILQCIIQEFVTTHSKDTTIPEFLRQRDDCYRSVVA